MNTWGEAMQSIGALREEVRFLRKGIDDLMAEKALLEDRVSELEARIPAPEIRTRTRYLDANGAIVDRTAPSETHDGRIVVSANEYERLLRIEKLARVVCDADISPDERLPALDFNTAMLDLENLAEALKR